MKIRIDSQTCCGHGRCYFLAPDVSSPDDHGRPVPADTDIDVLPSLEVQATHAQQACPEQAISVL